MLAQMTHTGREISTMKRNTENVFVTEGVPQYTFVPPPNYNEILLDIRRRGKPVIVEGQSGTGKTTCVKKILEELGTTDATYLTARNTSAVARIDEIISKRPGGTYVIDDFHRLGEPQQMGLANLAKLAAEQVEEQESFPKLVLIGINEVGSGLIQLVPDIAKRSGIHKIQAGTKTEIDNLIRSGCEELNIQMDAPERVFTESKGDYWLTQQLCQSICTMNDVLATEDASRVVVFELTELRQRVIQRIHAGYYPAVKEFCRGQRFRPTNDPYFKLLKSVGQQDSSIVDLSALANSAPEIRGSINNIKERRLTVLLQSKPVCARYFFYNQETKTFAIEDPALSYFLKHLDWDALRVDCGFREEEHDYEYDFALSFAGENRDLARELAEQLEILDAHVFFDEYFEANFLGGTWSAHFKRIFATDSRLVVCLLDEHYATKIWPTFEKECFQPRVADEEVIPIYLDDTSFVGIPKDVIGIKFEWDSADSEWKRRVTDELVFKLAERLSA